MGGVSQWWFRGTWKMQILHVGVLYGFGRTLLKRWFGVSFGQDTWPAEDAPNRRAIQPIDPVDSARALAPMMMSVSVDMLTTRANALTGTFDSSSGILSQRTLGDNPMPRLFLLLTLLTITTTSQIGRAHV